MHKLFERDNAIEIPRACLGIAKGLVEVFVKPAAQDLIKKMGSLTTHPPQELPQASITFYKTDNE